MAHDDLAARVRRRLRQLRFERGRTLAQVAAGAGMTASAVSRLESGARGLTLEHLPRLAAGLGVTLDALLDAGAGAPPEPAADGKVWWPLVDDGEDGVRAYRLQVPPSEGDPILGSHEGHVWLFILSGRLRLVTGAREVVLEPGDVLAFNTWTPHWIGAAGDPVDLLAVFAPDAGAVRLREPPSG